jgi:hypothetical protein
MTETATQTDERLASAIEVSTAYEAGPAVRAIAYGNVTPVDAIEQLSASGELLEAIQFMARWLTKREAIWWGAMCLWQSRRPQMSAPAEGALQAIVLWVLDPNEEQRYLVREKSSLVKATEPVSALALALYFSGGSISKPGLPVVEPEADATADTIAKMLRSIAARVPNYRQNEAYQQFLRIGMEIVSGESHWEK